MEHCADMIISKLESLDVSNSITRIKEREELLDTLTSAEKKCVFTGYMGELEKLADKFTLDSTVNAGYFMVADRLADFVAKFTTEYNMWNMHDTLLTQLSAILTESLRKCPAFNPRTWGSNYEWAKNIAMGHSVESAIICEYVHAFDQYTEVKVEEVLKCKNWKKEKKAKAKEEMVKTLRSLQGKAIEWLGWVIETQRR